MPQEGNVNACELDCSGIVLLSVRGEFIQITKRRGAAEKLSKQVINNLLDILTSQLANITTVCKNLHDPREVWEPFCVFPVDKSKVEKFWGDVEAKSIGSSAASIDSFLQALSKFCSNTVNLAVREWYKTSDSDAPKVKQAGVLHLRRIANRDAKLALGIAHVYRKVYLRNKPYKDKVAVTNSMEKSKKVVEQGRWLPGIH